MRILMLLSQTEITGAEVHAVQLGEWLQGQGCEVFLMSDTLTYPTKLHFFQRAIHPRGFFRQLRNIFFLRSWLKHHKIDVLHAHSRAAVRVGFWARWGLKVGFVSTVHGRQHFSWSKRFFNLYGQHVIAVCAHIKKHLIEDFSFSKNHITVIGNPLRTNNLTFADKLSPGRRLALLGRTSGPKGEQTSLFVTEVFPELLKKSPDYQLDLIGGPVENLSAAAREKILEINQLKPSTIRALPGDDMEKLLENYNLIIGAGRVAISALIRGIPLWALGEHSSFGPVNKDTFNTARASNFGDIGEKAEDRRLPSCLDAQILHLWMDSGSSREARAQLSEEALKEYSFDGVSKRVFEIYKAARLKAIHPHPIPVLMYHMVTEKPVETRHRIFVVKDRFEEQLNLFKKSGLTSLTFKDLQDFSSGQKPWEDFPRKPFVITFDDGYKNNLTLALPLLKKYGFRAVIYLLSQNDLASNSWDQGEVPEEALLSASERQQLAASETFEIASHGRTHKSVTEMTAAEAEDNFKISKAALEEEFQQQVLSYAFTYGHRNDEFAEQAFRAGYSYIINTDQGGFHLCTPITSIFRVPIFPEDRGYKLWRKTRAWYRYYFYWTRGK